jgi:hypothetical protein
MESLLLQVDQVITKVRSMMNSGAPVHPEQYTNEGLKLAVIRHQIGREKAILKRKQLVAEKRKYAEAMEEGLAVTARKEFIRLETAEERTMYDLADTEHGDLSKVIDMVRSHASAIKEDR